MSYVDTDIATVNNYDLDIEIINDKLERLKSQIDNDMQDVAIKFEHLRQIQNIQNKILRSYINLCIALLIWTLNIVVLIIFRVDPLLVVAISLCFLLFILILFIGIIKEFYMDVIEKLTADNKIIILKEDK